MTVVKKKIIMSSLYDERIYVENFQDPRQTLEVELPNYSMHSKFSHS